MCFSTIRFIFPRSCDIVALQPNINEVNGLQKTVYRQQTKYIDKWQMTTIIFEHKCPQIIHKYPLIIQISLLQILFTVIYGAIHDYLCFILTLAVSTFSTLLYSLYFLFTLSTSTSVVSWQFLSLPFDTFPNSPILQSLHPEIKVLTTRYNLRPKAWDVYPKSWNVHPKTWDIHFKSWDILFHEERETFLSWDNKKDVAT